VVTDGAVLAREDFGSRLAMVAAFGPRVAVHLRDRAADGCSFWDMVSRWAPVVRSAGAMLAISARPDVAVLAGAHAVQLGHADLSPADARRVGPRLAIGRSVHSLDEARQAADEGADYLMAGTVDDTPSHPGMPGRGLASLSPIVAVGRPVIAIGGITPERAAEVCATGVWGVAAIRAVWDAPDPRRAAEALLAPWEQAA
jgi:thiamine-phosphate diphosphorylase